MKKILILNGPNLNLLGKREPEIYGNVSFEAYLESLIAEFPDIQLDYYQSNHEGYLIDKLQEANHQYDGVVMNPGAYAHTSIALADCIKANGACSDSLTKERFFFAYWRAVFSQRFCAGARGRYYLCA